MARLVTPEAFEGTQLCPIYRVEVPLLSDVESNLQSGRYFLWASHRQMQWIYPGCLVYVFSGEDKAWIS